MSVHFSTRVKLPTESSKQTRNVFGPIRSVLSFVSAPRVVGAAETNSEHVFSYMRSAYHVHTSIEQRPERFEKRKMYVIARPPLKSSFQKRKIREDCAPLSRHEDLRKVQGTSKTGYHRVAQPEMSTGLRIELAVQRAGCTTPKC